jgi:hypothetical protein
VEDMMHIEKEFEGYATFVRLAEDQGMTLADITAVINAIRFAGSAFDEVADVKDKTKFATLLRAIADADLAAAKLEVEMAGSLREVVALKEEVERLEKENESLRYPTFEMTVKEDGLTYVKGGLAKPICTNCSDSKRKPMYLSYVSIDESLRYWKCSACESKEFLRPSL